MKNTTFLLLITVLLFSCRKSSDTQPKQNSNTDYLVNIKTFLQDSLTSVDLSTIDFNRTIHSALDSGKINFIRIPFKGRPMKDAFILINTNTEGKCLSGIIVNIKVDRTNHIDKFSGTIDLSSLKNEKIKSHKIINGFIKYKPSNSGSDNLMTEDPDTLPEVVVVSYIPSDGSGISWSEWMNILDIYGSTGYEVYGGSSSGGGSGSSGGDGYGYYSPLDPFEGTPHYPENDDVPSTDDDIPTDDTKVISYEYPESLEAISVDAYMKCFSTIADAGSTCSIEVFTDLPVNGEPNTFFNWENGSPGHTFLQLKKSNGTSTVQQNIGFYPDQGWKTMLTPAPVTGKFVDNADHEFNASLKMSLTPEQLQTIINEILYLAGSIKYDIDENNCTDFALHVFNSVRLGNAIEIPKYDIPGGMAPFGTSTPQGLYQKLSSMKEEGGEEAANITLTTVLGWVGDSHGPCN